MAVTLCIPPRSGELCVPVRFLVRADSLVMELTARHRITRVEWDAAEQAVAMLADAAGTKAQREAEVRRAGYPAYTTSAGWLGYDDDKLRRLCREAVAAALLG